MVNSKSKGKRGENGAAKLLEQWWGGHFCRTPDSGAFMTTHTKQILGSGNDISGDLICPEDFPFCVEVKRRKVIDLFKCIRSYNDADDDHLASWWAQTVRDAKRTEKVPLLMFKEDRKQWYICLTTDFVKVLKPASKNYLTYDNFSIIMITDLTLFCKDDIIQLCSK